MKWALLISILFCSFHSIRAQQDKSPNKFVSPYDAIYNHLKYLQEDSYNPAQAAKSLYSGDLNQEALEKLAIELIQFYDGTGSFVYLEEVPRNTGYYDSLTHKERYIPFRKYPDVYVEKYGDQWLYSKRTVQEIDRLHKSAYPFGTDKLLNLLPKIGSKKYLGLHLWQLIGIFIIIVLCYTLHKVLIFLFKNLSVRLLHKYGKVELARQYLLPVARPFSLFIVILVVSVLVPVLQLPINVATYLIRGLDAILPLVATLFFYKLVDVFSIYLEKAAKKSANTLDDQLVPLARKALKTFVVIIGIFAILKGLRFDIIPLLTGLSIGGLAFALAAQDTLKNFFGSLMIFIDKPFQIGDWITSGNIDGTVEEVGFRSTRIRTFRDSVLYVPNSVIADSTVDNHGLRKYRRFYTKLSITYDTPTDLIEIFIKGVRKIVLDHPETRKNNYNIFLNEYEAHSLDIMLYIFFYVPTWNDELRCRQEIMLEVNKLAEHLGVRFAFPTQTLFVEEFPGKGSLTPHYTMDKSDMDKSMEQYFVDKAKTHKK